jgi:uncharacterized protein (DUF2126 family)
MAEWIDVEKQLPDEGELVTIRVNGAMRPDYYRIDGRWYALEDLDRWKMNTSRYWETDHTWYLKTEDIDSWLPSSDQ